jgi:hypothetical protein
LVGGLAGIATDVSIVTKPCGAILGSPYPDTILDGATKSPSCALVAPRIPIVRLGGTSHSRCSPWWHHESPSRRAME